MISGFRGKGMKIFIGIIIGFIAVVFAIEGVFMSNSGPGSMGGAVAGTVNGETITLTEFNRAYEQKRQFMMGIMGDKITEEQLKMFRVRESAFQEIAQRKLLAQNADDQGLDPSDEQIRQEIMALPYFQKDGKFDQLAYRQILDSNRMSPAQFEKMIREDLLVRNWMRNLNLQVQVSEAEARDDFISANTLRNIKYVALPSAAAKKGDLGPAELAEKIAPLLKADKKSDAAVNALLKPYETEVRTTEMFSPNVAGVPGVGDAPELFKDAFAKPSAIQGKAKVYKTPSQIVVALVTESKEPDLSKFEKEKKEQLAQLRERKGRALMDATVKQLTKKAKISANKEIVGELEMPNQG